MFNKTVQLDFISLKSKVDVVQNITNKQEASDDLCVFILTVSDILLLDFQLGYLDDEDAYSQRLRLWIWAPFELVFHLQ